MSNKARYNLTIDRGLDLKICIEAHECGLTLAGYIRRSLAVMIVIDKLLRVNNEYKLSITNKQDQIIKELIIL